jgi:hypothetical protein
MKFHERGYCPFRVQKANFQAGCALQLGRGVLCYSQDHKPLFAQDKGYFCPKLKFMLSLETYAEIEQITNMILAIQDADNTSYNLWPMLTGVANPKNQAKTGGGKVLQQLSEKVRRELEDIAFDLD